jgi:hypothetical protein
MLAALLLYLLPQHGLTNSARSNYLAFGYTTSSSPHLRTFRPLSEPEKRRFQSRYREKSEDNDETHDRVSEFSDVNRRKKTVSSRRFIQKVHPRILSQVDQRQQHDHQPLRRPTSLDNTPSIRSDNQVINNKKASSLLNDSTLDRIVLSRHKSLEELEQTMIQRWGTKIDRWTKDDDDEDPSTETSSQTSKGGQQQSTKLSSTIRSKPVLNPWDYEEQEKEKIKHKQNQPKPYTKRNSKMKADIHHDRDEYYDEDDEGYEPRSLATTNKESNTRKNNTPKEKETNIPWNDSIIRPSPMGGHGRDRTPKTKNEKSVSIIKEGLNSQNKVPTTDNSFFFRPPLKTSTMIPTRNTQDSTPLVRNISKTPNVTKGSLDLESNEKKIQGLPIARDAKGRELYLTLDQAKWEANEFYATDSILQSTILSNEDNKQQQRQQNVKWQDVGITHPTLLENLIQMKCINPLSVQVKSCPTIVCGSDVLISTFTGSGKTLAFLAPLAQRLLFSQHSLSNSIKETPGVQAIIITPGRELASQTLAVAKDLFKGTGIQVVLAIGGTPFTRNWEQIRTKKPHVVIGTPGRIAELVVGKPDEKGGKLKISSVESLVLDECDALLEYEAHREPTRAIMDMLKKRHGDSLQSILCSATADDLLIQSPSSSDQTISRGIDGHLKPGFVHIQADDDDSWITGIKTGATRVSRTAIHGSVHIPHQRFALDTLRKILNTEPIPQQALVFVDNARRVGIVVEKVCT